MQFMSAGRPEWITIDARDFREVRQHKWYTAPRKGSFTRYVQAEIDGRMVYLHRFLMKPGPDEVIDHIDGDATNNSRSNLRIVTHAENQRAARGLPGRYAASPKEVLKQVCRRCLKDGTERVYVYDRRTRRRIETEQQANDEA